jgi:hypothetical protein
MSLLICTGGYLLLPLGLSHLLTQELTKRGYDHVIIQLGYPGFGGLRVPVVSVQQKLGGETLLMSVMNAELQYSVPAILEGRVDRILLPDVAVQILAAARQDVDHSNRGDHAAGDRAGKAGEVGLSGLVESAGSDGIDQGEEDDASPWSLRTVNDLLQRFPVLPFEDLRLDRVSIFREKATGPLRKVTISGLVTYRQGELNGHLLFQGGETVSYELTVAGRSPTSWSITLVSHRFQTVPIVSLQSTVDSDGPSIKVKGQLDINVRELAPFIALLVPIGPELEKVRGRATVYWMGTTAATTALASLWRDPSTRLEGDVRAHVTLPMLYGAAKDITMTYQGFFRGNATEMAWTLEPGIPLRATIRDQKVVWPDMLRLIAPHQDQPLRVEHARPLHGTFHWSESPMRITLDGPLRVTYGQGKSALVVEMETAQAAWTGRELVRAEGTYRVMGTLPTGIASTVAAREITADIRGEFKVKGTKVRGTVFAPSSVQVRQVEQDTVVIPIATFQVQDPVTFQCDRSTASCRGGPITAAIRASPLKILGRDVLFAQALLAAQQIEWSRLAWQVQGQLSIRGVFPVLPPWRMQPTDWRVRFLANQAEIKAALQIDAPHRGPLISMEIDQPVPAGEGMLRAKVGPLEFDDSNGRLSRLITRSSWPVDLTDGRLTSTLDLLWVGGWGRGGREFRVMSGTATVTAEKLAGKYEKVAFKDASTTVTVRMNGLHSVALAEPAQVTVASLKTGVDIADLSFKVGGTWNLTDAIPLIELSDFRCQALGGIIHSPQWVADSTHSRYEMTVFLDKLDLAKVLSLEHHRALQGTGTLNGTLPVIIDPSGITVKKGLLVASPPGGVIRYTTSEDSLKSLFETNTELHVAARALSNFHYTVLTIGVDYANNGELMLTARVEGKNPDFPTVPPVHFNLTIQEHVPSLLKSLRLIEELERGVEKSSDGHDHEEFFPSYSPLLGGDLMGHSSAAHISRLHAAC